MTYLYILGQLFASVSVLIGIVFVAMLMLGNDTAKEKFTMGLVLLSAIAAFGFLWNWWG